MVATVLRRRQGRLRAEAQACIALSERTHDTAERALLVEKAVQLELTAQSLGQAEAGGGMQDGSPYPGRDHHLGPAISETTWPGGCQTIPVAATLGPRHRGLDTVSCEIVVLEDDAVIRDVLTDIVACIGLTVASVADAGEALERIHSSQGAAMLLTDIDLGPGPSGIEASRAAQERYPGLPVIYLTGFPSRLEGCDLRSNERFIPKPFRTLELINAIRSLGVEPFIR